MSEYSSLKATINANVKANNNQEITGSIMNSVLNAMVNSLGAGYQYMGVATPTNPGSAQTPDYKCFYIATTPGTYTNLGGVVVADGEVAILKYDSSWAKEVTGIASADQLNQLGQETTINRKIIDGVVRETKNYFINSTKQYKKGDVIALCISPVGSALTNRIDIYYSDWSSIVYYSLLGQWLIATLEKDSNGFIVALTGSQMVVSGSFNLDYFDGDTLKLFATREEGLLDLNQKVNINSINLVNPETLLNGYGIVHQSGRLEKSDIYQLSDYIPVSASGIISNCQSIAVYSKERTFLRVISNVYSFVDGDAYVRCTFITSTNNKMANYGSTLLPYSPFNPVIGYLNSIIAEIDSNKQKIDEVSEQVEQSEINVTSKIDVAIGKKNESCIVNDLSSEYVGFVQQKTFDVRKKISANIVAFNHDDCATSDIIGTRKIYNKYGFHSNFNYILTPFANEEEKEIWVTNIKQMVSEGHDLGIHAFIKASFWCFNVLFDSCPIGSTHPFSPTLSELKTVDGTGKNIFGYTVGDNTKFSEIGFGNVPSGLDVAVSTATKDNLNAILALYAWYLREDNLTGLDLDGNVVTKAELTWLEYWYNELIDNTLGYSKIGGGLSGKYSADYLIPENASPYEYYPDYEHLLNGKMVFFDDTTNPHYNDEDYQKVGRFSKGLFKGCASTCNYEVIDRLLAIFKAYIKHYYDVDKITSFSPHGRRFVKTWYKYNNLLYQDRYHKVLLMNESTFYLSRQGKFSSFKELLLNEGIKMTNHGGFNSGSALEGEVALYLGQRGIRSPFFNGNDVHTSDVSYLELFGTDGVEQENMDYSTFISFMPEKQEDWFKWAYEKAGQTISNGSTTKRMYEYFANLINIIRSCEGTGKIAVFSGDTIKHNAAQMCAIELVCQYCYENDIEIVTMEQAREIANSIQRVRNNYFPNPQFSQHLLKMLGGVSESRLAYLPEGLQINFERNKANNSFSVSSETIDEQTRRVFNIRTNNSAIIIDAKSYALPAGRYKLSFYAKKDAGSARIELFKKRNGDFIEQYYNGASEPLFTYSYRAVPTNVWQLFETTFVIEEPFVAQEDNTPQHLICDGYENNVSNIVLRFTAENATEELATLSISEPYIGL